MEVIIAIIKKQCPSKVNQNPGMEPESIWNRHDGGLSKSLRLNKTELASRILAANININNNTSYLSGH